VDRRLHAAETGSICERRGVGRTRQLQGKTAEPTGCLQSAAPSTDNGFQLRLCLRVTGCRQRGGKQGSPGKLARRRVCRVLGLVPEHTNQWHHRDCVSDLRGSIYERMLS
jgi:hypothetical protein